MKKSNTGLFIGLAFILIGFLYACSALDIFHFSIFFPGWWTLFIIVPSLYGLFREREKTGCVIGLVIGLCFLINAQGFDFHINFWPLILALICIMIGVNLIFPNRKHKKRKRSGIIEINLGNHDNENYSDTDSDDMKYNNSYTKEDGYLSINTIFGGKTVRLDNETFSGADINLIFGAIELDLRHAVISEDVYINANTIFGGLEIYAPAGVRIVTDDCAAAFGGVDVHSRYANSLGPDAPRLIISGHCVFGGLEII